MKSKHLILAASFLCFTHLNLAFAIERNVDSVDECAANFTTDTEVVESIDFTRAGSQKLAPQERANFIQNMGFMNMDKKRYNTTAFGDYDDWELLFFHGVTLPGLRSKIHRDLSDILLGNYSTPTDFKVALNAWAEKNQVGYQFAFYDDIVRLGLQYQQQGLVSKMEPIAAANGYIAEDLYAYLIKQRLFPLADPHDVLSHLASLTDHAFVQSLNQFSELISDVENTLGRQSNYYARASMKNSPNPKIKAYGVLWDHLYGTVRDSTHENWTYLVPGAVDEPVLFMQGNASFNAIINGIRTGDKNYFIREILNLAGYDNNFGTEELRSFSDLPEYLKNAHSKDLYDRYEEILTKSLMDREAYKTAAEKVSIFLDNWISKNAVQGQKILSVEQVGEMLRAFAVFVSQDPQLKFVYTKESKQALLDSAVALCDDYKRWLDSRYP